MKNDSYQAIKDYAAGKLSKLANLSQTTISKKVLETRSLFDKIGPEASAVVVSVEAEEFDEPTDEDWTRMTRELEMHYNVQMSRGVLIQGVDQQLRDNIWWTSKGKLSNDCYYWIRYRDYLRRIVPPDVVKSMDEDTDVIMDNIENPTMEQFTRYGMVVGHVQSGKTANYASLVCKAADAGYKFIVVIAGSINNLRNQTQKRLNEAFVGVDKGIPVGVGRLGGLQNNMLPISLTTTEQDFNKQDANKNSQGMNFDNISTPIILVVKKNSRTLKNVISWLKSQYKNQISNHAMLMIDDESDYASINTNTEDDPTAVNKNLRKLIGLFRKSAYVAYTATPYANIFIDHIVDTEDLGKDLFPQDFIYALQAPTNYFGARKIFLESDESYLARIEDHEETLPLKHKKEAVVEELPGSLLDAIRLFVINIGIRQLRGQGNKHNSMLVHATRFTAVHKQISAHIEEYIFDLRNAILAYGALNSPETKSDFIYQIRQTFESRHQNIEFKWKEILSALSEVSSTIIVRQVHQEAKIPLEYRQDSPTNVIVVGGTSLSRGFTLEGLSVSYFLRTTAFYDTLMQMGRWFGYRVDYEDICRIYLTDDMIHKFRVIIESTEDLFDDFGRMSHAKMTPKDFGLAVKHHPDSGLQVSARNKLKTGKDFYFDMKLDGKAKETSRIPKDSNINQGNLDIIARIIQDAGPDFERVNNSYVWKQIGKNIILRFLNDFKVYSANPFEITARMPIEFIIEYTGEIETEWDIALYSGTSKINYHLADNIVVYPEKRKVEDKDGFYEVVNRQVSSGAAEAVVFDTLERLELGSNRKDIREKMKRPLLMLHVLDTQKGDYPLLAAFGASFPGGIKSTGRTVKLKVNSVYWDQMLKEDDCDD